MALFADSDTVCEVCGCGAQASEWLINCKNSAWQVSERGTFDCEPGCLRARKDALILRLASKLFNLDGLRGQALHGGPAAGTPVLGPTAAVQVS